MLDEMEFMQDEAEQEDAVWTIQDDQMAEWAMKKILKAQGEYEEWKNYYAGMLSKIKEKTDNTVNFMTMRLNEYFRTVPHKETKTQEKYSLPSGDLILKKSKSVWVHEDDAALLKWVKDNGLTDCIKVTEKVSWADLKKQLVESVDGVICDKDTGVVCDVVKATTSQPEFVVANGGRKYGEE